MSLRKSNTAKASGWAEEWKHMRFIKGGIHAPGVNIRGYQVRKSVPNMWYDPTANREIQLGRKWPKGKKRFYYPDKSVRFAGSRVRFT